MPFSITSFNTLDRDDNGQLAQTFSIDGVQGVENLTIGLASVRMTNEIRGSLVMLTCDANCYIAYGDNPTASNDPTALPTGTDVNGIELPSGTVISVGVTATKKFAVIAA
jgi:hypothetical protein